MFVEGSAPAQTVGGSEGMGARIRRAFRALRTLFTPPAPNAPGAFRTPPYLGLFHSYTDTLACRIVGSFLVLNEIKVLEI